MVEISGVECSFQCKKVLLQMVDWCKKSTVQQFIACPEDWKIYCGHVSSAVKCRFENEKTSNFVHEKENYVISG